MNYASSPCNISALMALAIIRETTLDHSPDYRSERQ
jgi:hypothetical protein